MINYIVFSHKDVSRLHIYLNDKVDRELDDDVDISLHYIGNTAVEYYNKGWNDAIRKIRKALTIDGNAYMEIKK